MVKLENSRGSISLHGKESESRSRKKSCLITVEEKKRDQEGMKMMTNLRGEKITVEEKKRDQEGMKMMNLNISLENIDTRDK